MLRPKPVNGKRRLRKSRSKSEKVDVIEGRKKGSPGAKKHAEKIRKERAKNKKKLFRGYL